MHAINGFETPALDSARRQVLVSAINLGKLGFAAVIIDSEVNKIALLPHEA